MWYLEMISVCTYLYATYGFLTVYPGKESLGRSDAWINTWPCDQYSYCDFMLNRFSYVLMPTMTRFFFSIKQGIYYYHDSEWDSKIG